MKASFHIGCMMCGTPQRVSLDLDKDDDIASLGIMVARLLDDGHTVIAGPENVEASVTSIELRPSGLN